jgi:CubicO group peptidase (beta-lactamase class C family)
MKSIRIFLFVLSLFAANFSYVQQNEFNHASQNEPAQTGQSVTNQKKSAKAIGDLDKTLNRILKTNGITGMSYAIIDSQGNSFTNGLGLAKLEGKVSATADTIFRIGSNSKIFVDLAALKSVNESKLDLQASLCT